MQIPTSASGDMDLETTFQRGCIGINTSLHVLLAKNGAPHPSPLSHLRLLTTPPYLRFCIRSAQLVLACCGNLAVFSNTIAFYSEWDAYSLSSVIYPLCPSSLPLPPSRHFFPLGHADAMSILQEAVSKVARPEGPATPPGIDLRRCPPNELAAWLLAHRFQVSEWFPERARHIMWYGSSLLQAALCVLQMSSRDCLFDGCYSFATYSHTYMTKWRKPGQRDGRGEVPAELHVRPARRRGNIRTTPRRRGSGRRRGRRR